MAQIKISVRFHQGGFGIPLLKLSSLSGGLVEFLNAVCKDSNIKIDEKNWMARKFTNESLGFMIEHPQEITIDDAEHHGYVIKKIVENKFSEEDYGKSIMPSTIKKIIDLTKNLDVNEKLTIGVFNGKPKPEKVSIDPVISKKIGEKMDALNKSLKLRQRGIVQYFGEMRGKIQAWYIGSDEPHLNIREARTGEIVKCIYPANLYKEIQTLTKREGAYVYIFGLITRKKNEDKIDSFEIRKTVIAPEYHEGDWKKFLGYVPNITGGLSSEDFISGTRNNGE